MIAHLIQDPGRETGDAATSADQFFQFQNMPALWIVGLVIVPLVIGFAWWSYGGLARIAPRTRGVLSVLRGLAILLCLFAIAQPILEIRHYTQIQSQVHILVDDSASMQRRDTYPDAKQQVSLRAASGVDELSSHSRSELVQRVLEKEDGLIAELSKTHSVRLFRFMRKPLPIQNLKELTAKGPTSPIGDALDLHLAAVGATPLDAVILVSDGRSNVGLPPLEVASKYRAADLSLYTVGVGDPNPPRNVRIIGPAGPKEALRQEEVVFDIKVVAEGMEKRPVNVTLEASRNGGVFSKVDTKPARLGKDGEPIRVRTLHAFQEAGDYTLHFKVSEFPEETSLEDNIDVRFLRVNDEKIHVLYLEDVPRWEYRYIHRGLKRVDESIVMQSYLFDASGDFHQEHSDGLSNLVDIPRTREEMFRYHVILLGDIDPQRFGTTEEQRNRWMRLLVEFVEFGGGVGFIYGDRFMPEAYRGTVLQDLLPVVLESLAELEKAEREINRIDKFRLELHNPGAPHDIALLTRDVPHNARLFERDLEGLRVYYPVQQPKAGAEVILRHPVHKNRFGKRAVATAGPYSRGRTFFMATDETWLWRKTYGEFYHDTFWRNVVRHLAENRLRRRDDRVDLRLNKVIAETGEPVKIMLTKHDDELHPSAEREATVFLRRSDAEPERRVLRAVPGELGNYQGTFTLDRPASVSVLVFDNDNPGDKVLAREDVLVKIPDREMNHSSQDQATLETTAQASKGGRYVFLGNARDLAVDFRDRRAPDTEIRREVKTLWDKWWVLLVVLGLLAMEWLLRKRARLV
ncbi:MAG: vWA domain-containing protein [Planctomycetota bacterium]|nr:vWA domain-containing protein [Planctomycetota bacterium]